MFISDQNDLFKCLARVSAMQAAAAVEYDVIVLGDIGGRFDQSMQSINALYVWYVPCVCMSVCLCAGVHACTYECTCAVCLCVCVYASK